MTSAFHSIAFAGAITAGIVLLSANADAQSAQKHCGDQWKAAKAAGTVPADQKWADYLKECRARMAQGAGAGGAGAGNAPAAAPAAAPANPLKPAPSAPAAEAAKSPAVPTAAPAQGAAAPEAGAKPKKPATAGQLAERARMKQCGAEWTANKAQLTAQTPGLKWTTYWSECNKRLKAAGQ
jgi:hypothetical protein